MEKCYYCQEGHPTLSCTHIDRKNSKYYGMTQTQIEKQTDKVMRKISYLSDKIVYHWATLLDKCKTYDEIRDVLQPKMNELVALRTGQVIDSEENDNSWGNYPTEFLKRSNGWYLRRTRNEADKALHVIFIITREGLLHNRIVVNEECSPVSDTEDECDEDVSEDDVSDEKATTSKIAFIGTPLPCAIPGQVMDIKSVHFYTTLQKHSGL